MLGAYHRNANSVTGSELPTFVDADRYIEAEQTDTNADGIFLKTDVEPGTGGNIIQAYLFWGEVDATDSNIVTWFGELNADVNGDTVSGGYDWRYLTITNGVTETPAYSQLNFDASGNADKIIVPVLFQRGGDQVSGNLQLSLEGVLDARTSSLQYTYGKIPGATPIIVGLGFDDLVGNQDLVFTGTASPL